MKVLLVLVVIIASLFSHGQFESLSGDYGNNDCATAYRFCIQRFIQNFNFPVDERRNCDGGTFYYSFDFKTDFNNQINLQISGGGSYELYGAITGSDLAVCSQIQNYQVVPITGELLNGQSINLSSSLGKYILKVTPNDCKGFVQLIKGSEEYELGCEDEILCTECITSFSPRAGKYVVSAWVKEKDADGGILTYINSSIDISFVNATEQYSLVPKGQIIDGWQRIEMEIDVPAAATGMDIKLNVSNGESYFDDIRFFPFDGSMMSYVYDPESLRLMAELDERNYATFYEYDEEGKLIRVKKETARGVMTIQENRDNTIKQ